MRQAVRNCPSKYQCKRMGVHRHSVCLCLTSLTERKKIMLNEQQHEPGKEDRDFDWDN